MSRDDKFFLSDISFMIAKEALPCKWFLSRHFFVIAFLLALSNTSWLYLPQMYKSLGRLPKYMISRV